MSNDKNKWRQPAAPPPPLFVGQKERDLIKQVNDELIENVIGQQILYFPISPAHTNFHPIYGEAIHKTFLPPIRVYALIEWEGWGTSFMDNVAVDRYTTITIHFHKRRLTEDQDLNVTVGDFVQYGANYYEIVSLDEPMEIFGQTHHKIEISAKCIYAREDLFNAD
tara:strand:+ start:5307 stop:5804 length:498 start_codon:yes stop_codon:yes gene_type:complete